MGIGKVVGFFGGAIIGLVILVATGWFAFVAYRRRRESGFLWLLLAVAAQLLGAVLGRIAFSPVTIVEHPVKEWFAYGSAYASGIAPIFGLIGWILLARRKNA